MQISKRGKRLAVIYLSCALACVVSVCGLLCWWAISPVVDISVRAPGVGVTGDYGLPPNPVNVKAVLEKPNLLPKLEAFRKKNTDGVAYLYIPGTDIKNEVVQASNNDYYLRRSSMGVYYREHGCYFADYRCHLGRKDTTQTPSQNLIIYGHNIYNDGTYFAQLMDYTKWAHAARYPYIYVQTKNGLTVYQIFAAFYTGTDFYYIQPDPAADEMKYIVQEAIARSEFQFSTQPDGTGHYLTLSTCCYKYKNKWGTTRKDQRFVVMAFQIDPKNPPKLGFPVKNPQIKPPFGS